MTDNYIEIIPSKYYEKHSPSLDGDVLTEGTKFKGRNNYRTGIYIGYLAYRSNRVEFAYGAGAHTKYYVIKSSFSKNRFIFLNVAFGSILTNPKLHVSAKLLDNFCQEIDKYTETLTVDSLLDLAYPFITTTLGLGSQHRFLSYLKQLGDSYTILRAHVRTGNRKLSVRQVNIVLIEDIKNVDVLNLQHLVICHRKSKTDKEFLDFGSLCYRNRISRVASSPSDSDESRSVLVDESSFSKIRVEVIRGLLDGLISSKIRNTSYSSSFRDYKACFYFIDQNYETDPLSCVSSIEEAYSRFTQELQNKLVSGQFKTSTASRHQQGFLRIIQTIYAKEYRVIEAKYVKISEKYSGGTEAESKIAVKKFFNHLLEHTLKLHKEIHEHNIPPIVKMNNIITTYTISGGNRVASSEISHDNYINPIGTLYDHYNGKVRNVNTLINEIKNNNSANTRAWKILALTKVYNSYNNELELIENDRYSSTRYREIINRLVTYYAIILCGITGANSSDIEKWEYVQSLEVIKDPINKELIQVKFRANGRETKYPIGGNKGLKILKNYLVLREKLSKVSNHDNLFVFVLGVNSLTNISGFKRKFPSGTDRSKNTSWLTYRSIMGTIKSVSLRQLRLNKSIVLQALSVNSRYVADLLNHTKQTNRRSYLKNNIDDRVQSFSEYWSAVKAGKIETNDVTNTNSEDEKLVSGHCKDKGEPIPINVESSFNIDCKEEYGCLFCKNYVCHLDEDDIHKLLSLRYVVKTIKNFATDYSHAEDVFRFILVRVEKIMAQIRSHKQFEAKLDEYINKVDNLGVLTPYWERKLSRYEDMGLYI